MEVWLHAFAFPGQVAELARWAEESGFAGMLVADSQNLTADVWIELALAAEATSRLRLGPGVTNPITRHLVVTASAAATLSVETGGRAVLGFAQGDSALTQIGERRLSVAGFEDALQTLQALLRGEEVEMNRHPSAIRWLADSIDKVPVHVAATGELTIAAAARHAEGVDLTVGAQLDRLCRGAEIARDAAPRELTLGAYLNVGVDPDRATAHELVRGSVATFARFSAERPAPSKDDRATLSRLAHQYDERRHGQASAGFARELDDDFIDGFAVAGAPEQVAARLEEIGSACGLQRLIVVPGSLDADPSSVRESNERFVRDVLPRVSG